MLLTSWELSNTSLSFATACVTAADTIALLQSCMLFMYCLHSGKLQNTLTCPTELALPRALAADADCDDIIYALTNTHVWSLRLTPGTAAAIWGVPLQFAAGAALLAAGSGIVVTVQETNHYTFTVSVLSRADGSCLSTFTHGGDCVSVGVMKANAILLGSSWFYGGCRLYTQTGDDILEVTTGLSRMRYCALHSTVGYTPLASTARKRPTLYSSSRTAMAALSGCHGTHATSGRQLRKTMVRKAHAISLRFHPVAGCCGHHLCPRQSLGLRCRHTQPHAAGRISSKYCFQRAFFPSSTGHGARDSAHMLHKSQQ
jgi:hypothetical protein